MIQSNRANTSRRVLAHLSHDSTVAQRLHARYISFVFAIAVAVALTGKRGPVWGLGYLKLFEKIIFLVCGFFESRLIDLFNDSKSLILDFIPNTLIKEETAAAA